ncbi:MAG: cysteine hydrolase [Gammaproteobacteria bacterium]
MKPKVKLLIIDPQNDFMDQPESALPVPGATASMQRLAQAIRDVGHRLDDIIVTMCFHSTIDIGHPYFWENSAGEQPPKLMQITAEDLKNGVWRPRDRSLTKKYVDMAEQLEAKSQHKIMCWGEHCIPGTPGHNIQSDLMAALQDWERTQHARFELVAKGNNPYYEHYGALAAEIEDPNDPTTMMNDRVLEMLANSTRIFVAGEEMNHCVRCTVRQITDNIGIEHLNKITLLTDCMDSLDAIPSVIDFPAMATAWLQEQQQLGLPLGTTDDMRTLLAV